MVPLGAFFVAFGRLRASFRDSRVLEIAPQASCCASAVPPRGTRSPSLARRRRYLASPGSQKSSTLMDWPLRTAPHPSSKIRDSDAPPNSPAGGRLHKTLRDNNLFRGCTSSSAAILTRRTWVFPEASEILLLTPSCTPLSVFDRPFCRSPTPPWS